jgi:hypothetical protein
MSDSISLHVAGTLRAAADHSPAAALAALRATTSIMLEWREDTEESAHMWPVAADLAQKLLAAAEAEPLLAPLAARRAAEGVWEYDNLDEQWVGAAEYAERGGHLSTAQADVAGLVQSMGYDVRSLRTGRWAVEVGLVLRDHPTLRAAREALLACELSARMGEPEPARLPTPWGPLQAVYPNGAPLALVTEALRGLPTPQ